MFMEQKKLNLEGKYAFESCICLSTSAFWLCNSQKMANIAIRLHVFLQLIDSGRKMFYIIAP